MKRDVSLKVEWTKVLPKVKTISETGQPSKREHKENEATHALCRSRCDALARRRGTAMEPFRNAAGDKKSQPVYTRSLWTVASRRKARSKESQCWSDSRKNDGRREGHPTVVDQCF